MSNQPFQIDGHRHPPAQGVLVMLKRFGFVIALVAALVLAPKPAQAQAEIQGQRVYSSGHSFHYFMPGILADMAKKSGIKDHAQLGLSAIGGSRVIQHWTTQTT